LIYVNAAGVAVNKSWIRPLIEVAKRGKMAVGQVRNADNSG